MKVLLKRLVIIALTLGTVFFLNSQAPVMGIATIPKAKATSTLSSALSKILPAGEFNFSPAIPHTFDSDREYMNSTIWLKGNLQVNSVSITASIDGSSTKTDDVKVGAVSQAPDNAFPNHKNSFSQNIGSFGNSKETKTVTLNMRYVDTINIDWGTYRGNAINFDDVSMSYTLEDPIIRGKLTTSCGGKAHPLKGYKITVITDGQLPSSEPLIVYEATTDSDGNYSLTIKHQDYWDTWNGTLYLPRAVSLLFAPSMEKSVTDPGIRGLGAKYTEKNISLTWDAANKINQETLVEKSVIEDYLNRVRNAYPNDPKNQTTAFWELAGARYGGKPVDQTSVKYVVKNAIGVILPTGVDMVRFFKNKTISFGDLPYQALPVYNEASTGQIRFGKYSDYFPRPSIVAEDGDNIYHFIPSTSTNGKNISFIWDTQSSFFMTGYFSCPVEFLKY